MNPHPAWSDSIPGPPRENDAGEAFFGAERRGALLALFAVGCANVCSDAASRLSGERCPRLSRTPIPSGTTPGWRRSGGRGKAPPVVVIAAAAAGGRSVKRFLKSGLGTIDWLLARTLLSVSPERPALISVFFHSIVADSRDYRKDLIDPSLAITTGEFREFLEHFLEQRYTFLSPEDCARVLQPGNYMMITFDDGYANNRLALPLLEEYRVPGVFFLSTGHIDRGTCFWWDVLHRERTRRGTPPRAIRREMRTLMNLRNQEIEHRLHREFGARCLEPVGDLDRPFTPEEITVLSARPGVWWGNHTVSHARLGTCAREVAFEEIRGSGEWIASVSGQAPQIIAYPGGSWSDEIVEISRALGLKVGLTTEARKNRFPLDGRQLMRLGRFKLRTGEDIRRQCVRMRSDLNLSGMLRNALRGH